MSTAAYTLAMLIILYSYHFCTQGCPVLLYFFLSAIYRYLAINVKIRHGTIKNEKIMLCLCACANDPKQMECVKTAADVAGCHFCKYACQKKFGAEDEIGSMTDTIRTDTLLQNYKEQFCIVVNGMVIAVTD